MEVTVFGRIEPEQESSASLSDCRIDVVFQQRSRPLRLLRSALPAGVNERHPPLPPARSSYPQRLSTRTDDAGEFNIDLPDVEFSGDLVEISVSSPAGQQIAHQTLPVSSLSEPVVIKVDPGQLQSIALQEPINSLPDRTRRLTGRVLDRDGKTIPSGVQVLIFAQFPSTDSTEPSPSTLNPETPTSSNTAPNAIPVVALKTEVGGYFASEVPGRIYKKAFAVVARIASPVTFALEEGYLPRNLPIVVDWPADESSAASDCECDGVKVARTPTQEDIANNPDAYSTDLGNGRCVQFTVPNRSIDEFSFYSVIRTTEPDIVAFNTGALKPVGTSRTDLILASLQAELDAANAAVDAAKIQVQSAEGELANARTNRSPEKSIKDAYDTVVKTWYSVVWSSINNMLEKRKVGEWDPDTETTLLASQLHTAASIPSDVALAIARKLVSMVQPYTAEVLKHQWGDITHTIIANAGVAFSGAAALADGSIDDAENRLRAARAQLEQRNAAAVAAAAALEAQKEKNFRDAQSQVESATSKPVGRVPLTAAHPVDWDESPTFYQTSEIAHGHLLHFKQVWYADGYSLGDLLYSLPLAPGQKKLVSVLDWERREKADRAEDNLSSESLSASMSRDRDLGEVVSGALSESSRGGSKSTSAGVGVGTGGAGNGSYEGFNFGALIGVSGGYGESNSSAWQDSSKNIAGNSLQNLRDKTVQSASAVRSLRTSVVSTAVEGEAVRATTEVVANHNHCHALTIQYFEVLRHLKLQHELVDVQECLFVPLPMSEFDLEKALRWRQELRTYLKRAQLVPAFDAARRVMTNWSQVEYPLDRYADEYVKSISGELLLTVLVPLPPFPEIPKPRPEDSAADTAQAIANAVNPTTGFLGVLLAVATGGASLIAGAATTATINATKAAAMGARSVADGLFGVTDPLERYKRFHQEIAPGVVEGFIDQLELYARVGATLVRLDSADFTLVSEYQPGIPLAVSLRAELPGQYKRSEISQLIIKSSRGLPRSFRAIVNSANIRYRSQSFEHTFVNDQKINDDIDPPIASAVITSNGDVEIHTDVSSKGAMLFTPLDEWEQRKPRVEDRRLSSELVEHLNNNFEYYHHAIWWAMDPNRRYMLLDGFYAPGSRNRSVASVVENRLIGIVGNSVVLPVARGVHLDPRFKPDSNGNRVNLIEFYKPDSPIPPVRVSLPTRGVFAEAVMGSCNSCESIDDSRFWRWQDSPIDEPPGIEPVSMSSRRTDPLPTQPTQFPSPIVSIQNAPSVPDPTGVGAAIQALGKQTFADITGLAGTQANAAAAFQQTLDTALKFGQEAAALAKQAGMLQSKDKVLKTIDDSESSGKISKEDATKHRNDVIDNLTYTQPPMVEAIPSTPDEWNPWPGTPSEPTPTTPTPTPTTPTPTPTPTPKTPRPKPNGTNAVTFPIALSTRSERVNGPRRPLSGNITLYFFPPGNQSSVLPIGQLMEAKTDGQGNQFVSLVPTMYTIGVGYAPGQKTDLRYLADPGLEATGVHGDQLINAVFGLIQTDLSTKYAINSEGQMLSEIEGESVMIPSKCKGLKLELVAIMDDSRNAAFDLDLVIDDYFTVSAGGSLKVVPAKIVEIAAKIAGTLGGPEIGGALALLSLVSMESNIDMQGKLQSSSSGKVKLTFKPAYLKSFKLNVLSVYQ